MESSILNTPPELIAFAGFDSWNDYENEIYAIYLCTRQISQNPYPIRILPS